MFLRDDRVEAPLSVTPLARFNVLPEALLVVAHRAAAAVAPAGWVGSAHDTATTSLHALHALQVSAARAAPHRWQRYVFPYGRRHATRAYPSGRCRRQSCWCC